jgi:outer membrane protein assembly factor BamC
VTLPRTAMNLKLVPCALAATLLLGGCSSINEMMGGDKIDYRSAAGKQRPLDVPPDLSQLARDTRYQPQSGVVSAAAVAAAPATAGAPAASPGAVAPLALGELRIERAGNQRWLVVPQSPDQLWPQLRSFWEKNGFTLQLDSPQTGVMETNWNENRARLPSDAVRNTIGRLFGNLFDTGERDLFRTRVERTERGAEIYLSHRGIVEVYNDQFRQTTTWRGRPSDADLEAEFLARLMAALAGVETPRSAAAGATTPSAAVAAVAAAPETPARARLVSDSNGSMLEVDESFDRAWRRVGLALDRGGFTVEDRDRAQGLYFVRYVDPSTAGQEEPNFFSRLFSGAKDNSAPVRYRIALKAAGAGSFLPQAASATTAIREAATSDLFMRVSSGNLWVVQEATGHRGASRGALPKGPKKRRRGVTPRLTQHYSQTRCYP